MVGSQPHVKVSKTYTKEILSIAFVYQNVFHETDVRNAFNALWISIYMNINAPTDIHQ